MFASNLPPVETGFVVIKNNTGSYEQVENK